MLFLRVLFLRTFDIYERFSIKGFDDKFTKSFFPSISSYSVMKLEGSITAFYNYYLADFSTYEELVNTPFYPSASYTKSINLSVLVLFVLTNTLLSILELFLSSSSSSTT